ncbi:hypothetical protein [Microvirga calopogonii]|uniref:hypothetical protein n=1 Tax=Microvirga calopogonii TaxID=2078013 RepID=UPI0013B3ECF4|nr:hypothetical protein [Microvirga calopogonii]
MDKTSSTMLELFQRMHECEKTLWSRYHLKDQGQYAALLVARALGACVVANGVNQGYDLEHPRYGRIEVRSRRYPLDGRREDRAQVPSSKQGLFDHFAHIVLDQDFTVAGAYLAPHDAIDAHVGKSKQRYVRFADGAALPQAVDITADVRAVQTGL